LGSGEHRTRTPPAIVAKLNIEVNKVLAKPELRDAILNLGAQPKGGTPEDFAKLIAAEVPKWADVVKASGTKAN
jgi:tripartite-type tricarboxylate transporter receptor subunit TctC